MTNKELIVGNDEYNVLIAGAGITGSLLALGFSIKGVNVSIYDVKSSLELLNRDRVYAINHSSRRLLEQLNLWKKLSPYMIPFETLSIVDTGLSKSVLMKCSDLINMNLKYNAIGWTIDHKFLMSCLTEELVKASNINTNYNELTPRTNILFDYFFAADGALSVSKNKLNIKSIKYRYEQACLTFKAILRVPYTKRAYEIFRNDGPMALLPMGSNTFQIVISAPYYKCKKLEKLSYSTFLDHIATFLPKNIEIDALINQPQTFPLSLSLSTRLSRKNNFLVGEAAHSIHPVGGQGLNLCLRDIKDVLSLLKPDHNSRKYKSYILFYFRRYIDILTTIIITHSLATIVSKDMIFLKHIKLVSYYILSKFNIVRQYTLLFMTDGINALFIPFKNK